MNAAFTKILTEALAQLQSRGATRAELDKARGLLCTLAENNRHACTVNLGAGVIVEVPANPLAQGLRMAGRMVR